MTTERTQNIQQLSYALLQRDPRNPNRMPPERYDAMKRHVQASGRCPVPLVRQLPHTSKFFTRGGPAAQYMLLDGHHRVSALMDLGFETGPVDVWGEMPDDEAGVYLLTLNRNVGEDDPMRRAELFHDVGSSLDMKVIAGIVPESFDEITSLIEMRAVALDIAPPEVFGEPEGDAAPVLGDETAIQQAFTLYPGQHKLVNMALLHLQQTMEGKNKPARALEELATEFLSGLEPSERTQAELLYLAVAGDAGGSQSGDPDAEHRDYVAQE